MSDRDTSAASTPDPEDIPREPSKHELDAAMTGNGATPSRPANDEQIADQATTDDDLAWPEGVDDEPVAPVKHAPSKAAVIAGGILAALLLGLAILASTQDPKSYMPDINKQQVAGVAALLKDEKIAEYTDDQVKAAQKSFAEGGAGRNMTSESAADALNVAKPDSVTAKEIKDILAKKKTNFQTVDGLNSGLRSQIILFAVTGALMALGTVFYQRGKVWARFIGMFVAGFIAVMYIMQIVQGALNIPGMVISLAAVAAFYFFMKGRLEDPPVRPAGAGGGGLLGGMFAPRGPRNKPTE